MTTNYPKNLGVSLPASNPMSSRGSTLRDSKSYVGVGTIVAETLDVGLQTCYPMVYQGSSSLNFESCSELGRQASTDWRRPPSFRLLVSRGSSVYYSESYVGVGAIGIANLEMSLSSWVLWHPKTHLCNIRNTVDTGIIGVTTLGVVFCDTCIRSIRLVSASALGFDRLFRLG